MRELQREFWRHRPTGYVWAVERVGKHVTGCSGPIAPEDADPELLDHLQYDSRDVSWVRQATAEFEALNGGQAAAA